MADRNYSKADGNEQRFQLLVNSVTDYAIYMLDPDGHVASWNAGARRFKGYEADEIIGHHFSRFFTEEDRAAGLPQKALKTAAAEGRFEAEGWRLRKDGTRFWANAVLDPIYDEGRLVGYAKITRDLTEKRAAEQALIDSERQFRMLVQGVRDYAIYMLDLDGRVSSWNSGAEMIKGYTAKEIIGQHFSLFYTPEDREQGEPGRALETAVREGKYEKEAQRLRKDGTRFWAHVVIDPIYDEDGRHVGYAKITRDVSEKRHALQELDDTRAALFQSQKLQAIGELTGGIAHDFNNLITVIRGAADLLKRGKLREEKREKYLEAIIETADRATALTNHLLAFGRRQALKPEVIDVNIRLDAFVEVLSRTLGGQVQVELDLAPSLGLIEADITQLETALLNAAINARDAMPNGGRLTLSTRNIRDRKHEMIAISVTDTGEGMPEEVMKRCFEPFFTTKPIGKGTGLGLSQIHGFAAQTGGRVEIDSRPGEGTTVTLILPRTEKVLAPANDKEHEILTGHGLKVLLVEDNDAVREFAEHLLADLDYAVVSARSADEALARLEDESFDLLFTDIVMPERSGIDLAQTVRRKNPRIPILLASGYSAEVINGSAVEFDVISKPYSVDTLSLALAKARGRDAGVEPSTAAS